MKRPLNTNCSKHAKSSKEHFLKIRHFKVTCNVFEVDLLLRQTDMQMLVTVAVSEDGKVRKQ